MEYSFYAGLFTAVVFWILCKFRVGFSIYSLIMAFLMTAFSTGYSLIGFKVLKTSGVATYTMFLMNGGMIIPYITGIFFLNEEFSLLRTVGLVIMIAAIIISNGGRIKTNKKDIWFCICIFILNGLVSVVSKFHQVEKVYEAVSAAEFVFYTGVIKFVVCGIILFVMPKKNGERSISIPAKIVPLIVLAAVISGVSYLLQLFGASNLPATVIYPFITGGSVVLSALASAFVFKEKMQPEKIIGTAMCFIGTCMFL